MLHHFHYTVKTKASPAVAWEVYSNCKLWKKFTNIYGEVAWTEGKPWQVGSRMEIEILRPVRTTVDHLIICCEPARELGWIDRALGVTMDQWVEFDEYPTGGTRIHTWGELNPAGLKIAGRPAEELVNVFTETWYENYRVACDELADMLVTAT